MTLGWAIVIVAILYLLDKHNLFRKAVVCAAVLAGIVALGWGTTAVYGWYQAGNAPNWMYRSKPIDLSAGLVSQPDATQLLQPGETLGAPVKQDTPVTPDFSVTMNGDGCPQIRPDVPRNTAIKTREGKVCPYKNGKLDWDAIAKEYGAVVVEH